MDKEICKDCGIEKEITNFRRNSRQCRKCESIYKKEYYKKTKEYKKEYSKNYSKENKEYYQKYRNEHKDEMAQYNKNYYQINKRNIIDKNIKYEKNKAKNDNIYKFKKQIRKVIYQSFTRKHFTKNSNTEKIVGCKIEELIEYLLNTYKENYGVDYDSNIKIHIDHIIPLATAKTEEEVIKLCHYTNLQLLKAEDNLHKGAKLDYTL